jgi:hypothetical protein
MSLTGCDFINIAHGVDNTRIYRKHQELFSYTATITDIIPFATMKAHEMVNHLDKMMINSWGEINLTFNYRQGTINKKKKHKLDVLLGIKEIDSKILLRWIMMLFAV